MIQTWGNLTHLLFNLFRVPLFVVCLLFVPFSFRLLCCTLHGSKQLVSGLPELELAFLQLASLSLFVMFEIWFKVPLPKGPIEAALGFV